ncbi:MAG: twin-arginine translocation signal domain-containing protein [Gemmataceae bacterium]
MLSPEQVERKVNAIFGKRWGKLHDQLAVLYGGIDSKEVTERAADPSGAMGAIQRTLANEVACEHTMRDFLRKPGERRLFPDVEPSVLPGASPAADAAIRRTIVHLHERVLGRHDAADSAEVTRTYDLFAGLVADAREPQGAGQTRGVPVPREYSQRSRRPALHHLVRSSAAWLRTCSAAPSSSTTAMPSDRRDFLKRCGLAGAGVAVPLTYPLPTRGEGRTGPYEGPYYVILNAAGGWTRLTWMDPKGVNGINRLYRQGDIRRAGDIGSR